MFCHLMRKPRTAVTLLNCLGLFALALRAQGQPSVTTQPATSVTVSNATLNGTVNPNGAVTTAYFQYGLTANYENISTASVLPSGNAAVAVPGFGVNSLRGPAGPNVRPFSSDILHWGAIAASADGLKLAAAGYTGGIWLSTNGGTSWAASSAFSNNWSGIASSADGARQEPTHPVHSSPRTRGIAGRGHH